MINWMYMIRGKTMENAMPIGDDKVFLRPCQIGAQRCSNIPTLSLFCCVVRLNCKVGSQSVDHALDLDEMIATAWDHLDDMVL